MLIVIVIVIGIGGVGVVGARWFCDCRVEVGGPLRFFLSDLFWIYFGSILLNTRLLLARVAGCGRVLCVTRGRCFCLPLWSVASRIPRQIGRRGEGFGSREATNFEHKISYRRVLNLRRVAAGRQTSSARAVGRVYLNDCVGRGRRRVLLCSSRRFAPGWRPTWSALWGACI
jgi:hypothetical protein